MTAVSRDGRLTELTATARKLADDLPGPLHRITVALDDARIELEWAPGQADAVAPVAHRTPDAEPAEDPTAVVRSPVVGTFYRAAAPGEPPFVAVGDTVGPDTVIGIVEAMKLMNRIAAGRAGTVRGVLLPDGGPVEFDQPLVLLDPVADDETGGQ